jgi:hypothetical protein
MKIKGSQEKVNKSQGKPGEITGSQDKVKKSQE